MKTNTKKALLGCVSAILLLATACSRNGSTDDTEASSTYNSSDSSVTMGQNSGSNADASGGAMDNSGTGTDTSAAATSHTIH